MKKHCSFWHSWTEWRYISDTSCIQKRTCKDCIEGEEYRDDIVHDYKNNWTLDFSSTKMTTLKALRELVELFSSSAGEEQIKLICAEIGIPYHNIHCSHNIKDNFIELLNYANNIGKISDLFKSLQKYYIEYDFKLISVDVMKQINIKNVSFYISPFSSCQLIDFCKRCGEPKRREIHNYKRKKDICAIYDICEVCGNVKFIGEEHKLSTWEYVNDNSCEMQRFCHNPNCDYKEIKSADENHTWSNWMYIRDDSCNMERICLRCNKQEQQIQHNWGHLNITDDRFESNICHRCEVLDIKVLKGQWRGVARWNNGSSDEWVLNIEYTKPGFFQLSNIRGYLFIVKGGQCTVKQAIKGDLDLQNGKLSFKSKVKESTYRNYNPDNFSGSINLMNDKVIISGTTSSKNVDGTIELY